MPCLQKGFPMDRDALGNVIQIMIGKPVIMSQGNRFQPKLGEPPISPDMNMRRLISI